MENSGISEAHPKAYDEFLAAELWDLSVKRLESCGVNLGRAN